MSGDYKGKRSKPRYSCRSSIDFHAPFSQASIKWNAPLLFMLTLSEASVNQNLFSQSENTPFFANLRTLLRLFPFGIELGDHLLDRRLRDFQIGYVSAC